MVFFIIVFNILITCLWAMDFSVGYDSLTLITMFGKGKSVQAEVTCNCLEDIRISLKPSYHFIKEETFELNCLELGVAVDFYPFYPLGFYTGVSIGRFCYLFGYDRPEKNFLHLVDIRIGYSLTLAKVLLDFRVVLLEPGENFGTEATILANHFYEFKKYSFVLLVGYQF